MPGVAISYRMWLWLSDRSSHSGFVIGSSARSNTSASGSDARSHLFFGLADLRVASTLVVLVVHHGKFDASDGSWNLVLRNVVQLCAGVAVRTYVQ